MAQLLSSYLSTSNTSGEIFRLMEGALKGIRLGRSFRRLICFVIVLPEIHSKISVARIIGACQQRTPGVTKRTLDKAEPYLREK